MVSLSESLAQWVASLSDEQRASFEREVQLQRDSQRAMADEETTRRLLEDRVQWAMQSPARTLPASSLCVGDVLSSSLEALNGAFIVAIHQETPWLVLETDRGFWSVRPGEPLTVWTQSFVP